jgi:hypothetical protein
MFSYAPLGWTEISDRPAYAPVLPRSADPDVAAGSATQNASGSMGKATSQSVPGFCLFTISSARSMLSACTATLKRAAPLVTWTAILTISYPLYDLRSACSGCVRFLYLHLLCHHRAVLASRSGAPTSCRCCRISR